MSAPFRFALRCSFRFSISRLAVRLVRRPVLRAAVRLVLRLVLRPVLRFVCASRPALPSGVFRAMSSRLACRYASRPASRFHCLSAGHDMTFVWAPFRLACRSPSRLASRVRRLRFSLYAVCACRSSFLSCVSFPRSRHAVSCSMPFFVSLLRIAFASRPLRVAFTACP